LVDCLFERCRCITVSWRCLTYASGMIWSSSVGGPPPEPDQGLKCCLVRCCLVRCCLVRELHSRSRHRVRCVVTINAAWTAREIRYHYAIVWGKNPMPLSSKGIILDKDNPGGSSRSEHPSDRSQCLQLAAVHGQRVDARSSIPIRSSDLPASSCHPALTTASTKLLCYLMRTLLSLRPEGRAHRSRQACRKFELLESCELRCE
jgi:hypothetical protein